MKIIFDVEANGLNLPQYDKKKDEWVAVADRVWCICLQNVKSSEGISSYWHQQGLRKSTLRDALNLLSLADTLIGHNIIGYDLPLLKRLYNWEPRRGVKIVDTLILSRLLNPDRGSHSLGSWGERLGYNKVEHEDWTQYSPEMLIRCQTDVELNRRVYLALLEEMGEWDWSEAIELEHRFAEVMQRQEANGVLFDMGAAHTLEQRLSTEIEEIDSGYDLPGRYKPIGVEVSRPFKINGQATRRCCDWLGEEWINSLGGPFNKVEHIRLNLGSEAQVKAYLLRNGWRPTQYNHVNGRRTSPKITEDSFGTIDADFGHKIKRRKILTHRLSQLQGWIKHVRPDGRLSAAANTIGTPTGRCRHKIVVNVPAKGAAFGEEMRSLFTVPSGYAMVGCDAEQIELRLLAHFMGDNNYIQEILNGDIHTHNQHLAGLPTRDSAKSFIYALIYGAGDEKLGSLAGGSKGKGRKLRTKFLSSLPAFEQLSKDSKRAAARGWLKGLDGRKIYLRRGEDGRVLTHKALNALIQCADSVIMKWAAVWTNEILEDVGAKKIIDMHDEAEYEVKENVCSTSSLANAAEKGIKYAGEHFKLRIPLAGDAKIGKNWHEVH